MSPLDAFRTAWLQADRELQQAFSKQAAALERWHQEDRHGPALAVLLETTDEVDGAHRRWRVAFERYRNAKELELH